MNTELNYQRKNNGCDKSFNDKTCPICKNGVVYQSIYSINKCKEAFEKYCKDSMFPGSLEINEEGEYKSDDTFMIWLGFRAGYQARSKSK